MKKALTGSARFNATASGWKVLCGLIGLVLLCGSGPIFAADVTGVWVGRITFKAPGRDDMPRDVTLILKAHGSCLLVGTLSARWDGHDDTTEILDGKVIRGDGIAFAITTGASDLPRMNFRGKQHGDRLELVITGKNPTDGQELKLGGGLLKRAKMTVGVRTPDRTLTE